MKSFGRSSKVNDEAKILTFSRVNEGPILSNQDLRLLKGRKEVLHQKNLADNVFSLKKSHVICEECRIFMQSRVVELAYHSSTSKCFGRKYDSESANDKSKGARNCPCQNLTARGT